MSSLSSIQWIIASSYKPEGYRKSPQDHEFKSPIRKLLETVSTKKLKFQLQWKALYTFSHSKEMFKNLMVRKFCSENLSVCEETPSLIIMEVRQFSSSFNP